MKRLSIILVILLSISLVASAAGTLDLGSMTRKELTDLRDAIDQALEENHEITSDQREEVLEVTKQAVESYFDKLGIDVSWAWIQYDYTKEWNFYTLNTHIDLKDNAGKKQKPDVFSEVFDANGTFQLMYLQVGDDIILNNRAALPGDYRTSVEANALASTAAGNPGIQTSVTPPPTLKVSASELIKAYENNEVKADATYKGQLLELSGVVASVRTSWGNTIVEMGTGDSFEFGIDCYLNKNQTDKAAALDKGDKITIIGTGDGLSFLSPQLKDCRIP